MHNPLILITSGKVAQTGTARNNYYWGVQRGERENNAPSHWQYMHGPRGEQSAILGCPCFLVEMFQIMASLRFYFTKNKHLNKNNVTHCLHGYEICVTQTETNNESKLS
jgi:hypothetical protein